MSLINQMLQDLDARSATQSDVSRLPNDVRPLPTKKSTHFPIILAASALMVVAGGYGFYQWSLMKEGAPTGPVAEPQAVVPKVMVPAVPAESTPVVQAEPSASSPTMVPVVQATDVNLRMADALSAPAKGVEASAPAVSVAVPVVRPKPSATEGKTDKSKVKSVVSEPPLAHPMSTAPQGPETQVAAPRIEKTETAKTPRERADAEYRKSIIAVNQGRLDEAFEHLRKALQQNSLHAAARQLQVRLLLEDKRQDEAMQVLERGLEEQPAQIGWAMSLARFQVNRGDLDGAWRTLDRTMPAAGASADYLGFAAHILHRLGRFKESVTHYQSAIRLSPGDGRWWLGLGLALDDNGRSVEAQEAFRRAQQSGTLNKDLSVLVEQKLRSQGK